MSNRLKTLVTFIQAITDKTIEDVAKSINYTRVHLTKQMSKGSNIGIETLLKEKYRQEMLDFFGDSDLMINENQEPYDNVKVVDSDELLVHDSILIKGMLRVMLRNQAALISAQQGVPVASVLKQIAEAVRDETEEEFDEL